MSFAHHTVRRETTPAPALLGRLLLASRFDFQTKAWSLPAYANPQDAETTLALFLRGLLPAAHPAETHFSDPAPGGALNSPPVRSGFRRWRERVKTNPNHTKGK